MLESRAEARVLHLVLEGRAARSYALRVRTSGGISDVPGLTATKVDERHWELKVPFEGRGDGYVRRELTLRLR